MPKEVSVLRRRPRDRSKLEGLHGVVYTTLVSESYIHVGSSTALFEINEGLLAKLIESGRRDVEGLARAVKFEEVAQFNVIGDRAAIPGSSIKGNVRSRLELSFRPKGGYVRSCFIKARAPLVKGPLKGAHGWRHFRVWGDVLFEERGPPCDLTKMSEVCLVCDLFGTAGLKSLIDFSDFISEGYARDVLEQLSLEYGMRLVAATPNSRFSGRILFRNLSRSELGLLLLVGMRVGRSVLLGRLKYRREVSGRPFGRARYEVEAIEFLEESRGPEASGLGVRGGERVEGADLANLMERLRLCVNEEFGGEIVEVDEVAAVEQLS